MPTTRATLEQSAASAVARYGDQADFMDRVDVFVGKLAERYGVPFADAHRAIREAYNARP